MVIGTPAYMAPEQATAGKQITGAADVFALGSLLLYAANGRPPFGDGSGLELLYRIVHEEPDMGDLAEAVPGLAEIVTRCLAKAPADRPTAQELYDLAGDHTLPLTPASPAPWPRQVAERIAERAAFAARSPEDAFGPDTEEDDEPAVVPPPPVVPPTPGTPPAKKPRERRRRTMLLVLPIVVVTGTTLTVALSPYDIPGLGKDPGVSAKPSPTPSGSASSAPRPTGSPRRPPVPERHRPGARRPRPAPRAGSPETAARAAREQAAPATARTRAPPTEAAATGPAVRAAPAPRAGPAPVAAARPRRRPRPPPPAGGSRASPSAGASRRTRTPTRAAPPS
ncbi:protein kinase [Streptomyces zhihengii]